MKTEATNRPTNPGKQGSTGGNSVYVAIAGEVVNRKSVHLRNFVLNGKVSASNPLLHIHANRYGQVYETTQRTDTRTAKIVLGQFLTV